MASGRPVLQERVSDASDELTSAAIAAKAPAPSLVAAPVTGPTTAALQSKNKLYNPEATIPDLFGELDGTMLWDAIKDTYQVRIALGGTIICRVPVHALACPGGLRGLPDTNPSPCL